MRDVCYGGLSGQKEREKPMFDIYVSDDTKYLKLGHSGEDLARRVMFDLSDFITLFGEGTFSIVFRRTQNEDPYVVSNTESVDDFAIWNLTATDTAYPGKGQCELRYYVGDVLAKTRVYDTIISPSLTDTGETPGDPDTDLLDKVSALVTEAESAVDTAEGHVQSAEAWAVGQRGGTDVGKDDETYQNNAKYYSELTKNTLANKADKNHTHLYAGSDTAGGVANSAKKLADVSYYLPSVTIKYRVLATWTMDNQYKQYRAVIGLSSRHNGNGVLMSCTSTHKGAFLAQSTDLVCVSTTSLYQGMNYPVYMYHNADTMFTSLIMEQRDFDTYHAVLLAGHNVTLDETGTLMDEIDETVYGTKVATVRSNEADKLSKAPTIALNGAVTGTATKFDGSANISIPVTAVNANKLTNMTAITSSDIDAMWDGTYVAPTTLELDAEEGLAVAELPEDVGADTVPDEDIDIQSEQTEDTEVTE